ncbi:hypothetical protein MG295_00175 [Bacillus phage vB_BcgM]|nr:hypothetical protein MG295_00175 [Bacillus phage vB_BcgM]
MNFYREVKIEEVAKLRNEFFEGYLDGWHKGTCEFHQAMIERRRMDARKLFNVLVTKIGYGLQNFKHICVIYDVMERIEKGEKIYTEL